MRNILNSFKGKLKQPINWKEIIIVTFLILLIIFSLIRIVIYFFKTSQARKTTKQIEINIPMPTLKVTPLPSPKKFVLKRKSKTEWEKLASFSLDLDKSIIRWNNLLFYNPGSKIFSHNLNTGTTNLLFEETNDSRYISDFQIIDDTLFFSVGGYLLEGATFALDLPPKEKPKQISENPNAKIIKRQGRYWLISGEGDACWMFQNYSLLEPKTKKVTHIATSDIGCYDGEQYLDIFDKRDRMVFAGFKKDRENPDSESQYLYLLAVPINNPKVKEGVISKQDMPAGITGISYFESKDSFLLTGQAFYSFDFSNNKLIKIMDIPENWRRAGVDSWTNNLICLSKYISQNNDKKITAEINTDSKQLTENSPNCTFKPDPTPQKQSQDEKNNEIIKSLNLPADYQMVVE